MRALAGELFAAHYDEITRHKDVCKLDPDWAAYERVEKAGALLAIGAWVGSTMVGYSVTIVVPHLHYVDTILAQNDVLYVAPEHRGSSVGGRLISETERLAKERGASIMTWHAKPGTALDTLMTRLRRYSVHETIYARTM